MKFSLMRCACVCMCLSILGLIYPDNRFSLGFIGAKATHKQNNESPYMHAHTPTTTPPPHAQEEEHEFTDNVDPPSLPPAFAARPEIRTSSPEATNPPPSAIDSTLTLVVTRIQQSVAVHVCAFLLIALAAICVYIGKNKNANIATEWIGSTVEVLRENFSSVGFQSSFLTIKAYHLYELYCSGRKNCLFMHGVLECIPRQCFWVGHVWHWLCGRDSFDRMTLEVFLPQVGEGAILCVCKKKDQRDTIVNMWDLREFAKARVCPSLPSGFIGLSDTQEALDGLILNNKFVMKTLHSCADFIQSLYISDLCDHTHPSTNATVAAALGAAGEPRATKRVLRVIFSLPAAQRMDEVKPLLHLALHLTDAAAHFVLSDKSREAVRKLRMAYEKEKVKEQHEKRAATGDRRREDRRREEEERVEKMDEGQRRKYEEAQLKKELRKTKNKRFQKQQ